VKFCGGLKILEFFEEVDIPLHSLSLLDIYRGSNLVIKGGKLG